MARVSIQIGGELTVQQYAAIKGGLLMLGEESEPELEEGYLVLAYDDASDSCFENLAQICEGLEIPYIISVEESEYGVENYKDVYNPQSRAATIYNHPVKETYHFTNHYGSLITNAEWVAALLSEDDFKPFLAWKSHHDEALPPIKIPVEITQD